MDKIKIYRFLSPITNKYEIEYVERKPFSKIADFVNGDEIVALNGRVIREDEYNEIIPFEAELIITPYLRGGHHGKNILKAIASIAVLVAAIAIPGSIAGITSLESTLLSIGIGVGGTMLINALFPTPKPQLPKFGLSEETYGWSNIKTTVRQGNPIPVLYGKRRVGGNLIGYSTHLDGQNQYLDMDIGICGHNVDSISDIRINNQPVESFRNVTVDYRTGTWGQTPISFMGRTETPINSGSTLLYNQPVDLQTIDDLVQGIKVNFKFPYGLFYANDKGGLDARSVDIKIEYSMWNGTAWDTPTEFKTVTYSGAKSSIIRYSEEISGLPEGKYKVILTRLTTDNTNSRQQDKVILDSIDEIIYDDFSYPMMTHLGLEVLATDQLSGTMPDVTCLVERKIFNNGDIGISQQIANKPANNPAWIVYDILTNSAYGGGYTDDDIDIPAFTEWANYCSDNGIECNIYFDGESSVWEAILMVANESHGILKIEGSQISVIVDAPTVATQLFTVGNIVADSFKEHYLPIADRANVVEVSFYDEEHDFAKREFSIYSEDWNTEKEVKKSLTLYGITKYDAANKLGQYMLNYNKYLTKSIEFEADIDAIASTVGDVIKVQFDTPNWGYGGRIVSATSSQVVVDREIDFEDGKTYRIVYRTQDDNQYGFNWTQSGNVTTDTIPVSVNPLPQKYDVYTIGEVDFPYKLFRITSISRSDDLKKHISAIEYNPSIYLDVVTPTPLPEPIGEDLFAHNLTAEMGIQHTADGDKINFTLNWTGTAVKWKIFYRIAQGVGYGKDAFGKSYYGSPSGIANEWNFIKDEINTNSTFTFDFTKEEIYEFAVCGIGLGGAQSPDIASHISVQVTDADILYPAWGDGAKATWTFIKDVDLKWTPAIGASLDHYEVEYLEGSTSIVASVHTNHFTISKPTQRTYDFEIYAVNVYGNRSAPLTATATNPAPSAPTNFKAIEQFQKIVLTWDKLSDADILGYNVYVDGTKKAFVQASTYTYVCGSGETHTFKVAGVDILGEGTATGSLTASTKSIILKDYNLDIPLMDGIHFSANTSYMQWTAGTISYQGQVYNISAGTSTYKYLYWDATNPSVFNRSATKPPVGENYWLMAVYDKANGKVYPALQNKIMHAGILQASTITSEEISAKAITAEQIDTYTITADKYKQLRNTYVYSFNTECISKPANIQFEIVDEAIQVVSAVLYTYYYRHDNKYASWQKGQIHRHQILSANSSAGNLVYTDGLYLYTSGGGSIQCNTYDEPSDMYGAQDSTHIHNLTLQNGTSGTQVYFTLEQGLCCAITPPMICWLPSSGTDYGHKHQIKLAVYDSRYTKYTVRYSGGQLNIDGINGQIYSTFDTDSHSHNYHSYSAYSNNQSSNPLAYVNIGGSQFTQTNSTNILDVTNYISMDRYQAFTISGVNYSGHDTVYVTGNLILKVDINA